MTARTSTVYVVEENGNVFSLLGSVFIDLSFKLRTMPPEEQGKLFSSLSVNTKPVTPESAAKDMDDRLSFFVLRSIIKGTPVPILKDAQRERNAATDETRAAARHHDMHQAARHHDPSPPPKEEESCCCVIIRCFLILIFCAVCFLLIAKGQNPLPLFNSGGGYRRGEKAGESKDAEWQPLMERVASELPLVVMMPSAASAPPAPAAPEEA